MDAKTARQDRQGLDRRRELDFPVQDGHHRPGRHRHRQALRRRPGCSPTIRASPRPRAARSKITYIDGDEGVLLYRGYPIEQLAEHGDFLETCYLLLYGELPTAGAEGRFRLPRHAPHDGARADEPVLPGLPPRRASDGGDGRLGRRAVGLLSRLRPTSPIRMQRMIASIRMIAKMPTLAAMAYKYTVGQPFVYPTQRRSTTASNFLQHVLRGAGARTTSRTRCSRARWTASSSCMPTTSRTPRPRPCVSPARRAPTRSPASRPASPASGARRMAAPTKRRSRCWPRSARRPHPGIHQARQGQERSVPPDGLRPPRLQELRSARQDHAEDLPRGAGRSSAIKDDPLLRGRDGARAHRAAATSTSSRRSSIRTSTSIRASPCKAMGFPTSMFTVLFAVARTVGWIAQWKEMIEDPSQKIGRPRQLYTGATRRDYSRPQSASSASPSAEFKSPGSTLSSREAFNPHRLTIAGLCGHAFLAGSGFVFSPVRLLTSVLPSTITRTLEALHEYASVDYPPAPAVPCCVTLAARFTARASGYPTRPLKLMVAFPPGGSSDFVKRAPCSRGWKRSSASQS